MKYVLDSSVALKWVLAEVDADKAVRLRDENRAGIHELIAPDIFPVELGHALARAERQRRISVADGWTFWRTAMTDLPALHRICH
jgi:predicted nucleic acid-binding protein